MTPKEILEATADYLERRSSRAVVAALYEVTDYSFEHADNRKQARELIHTKVGVSVSHWAVNAKNSKEIADTLREIAKEIP